MKPLNIFIGYDFVESQAWHTLVQSIIKHSTVPVSVTPIKQSMLPMFTRTTDMHQSNEFSFTRFLVPHLCNYEGWALFMDCDMLFRTDPKELFDLIDESKDVMCVQHDYTPKDTTKYLGTIQYRYPRKNWSSVMLFNCEKCKTLTPEYVNTAPALDLHRMLWAENIGSLPVEWNHLVGEYDENPDAKNVHWTVGGPYFYEYQDAEFAKEWWDRNADATYCLQLRDVEKKTS